MDVLRRLPPKPQSPAALAVAPKPTTKIQASDALPLPLPVRHTNRVFSYVFMASLYFLMSCWRDKIRTSSPLHLHSTSEILAVAAFLSSFVYLFYFFSIAYLHSSVSSTDDNVDDDNSNVNAGVVPATCTTTCKLLGTTINADVLPLPKEDLEIIKLIVSGKIPSYTLESRLKDTHRAARLRREALKTITGRKIDGLPLDGFDYDSVLGQCCEMPIGYVALPVGIAGPLVLDGEVYYLPMATTEGCLVASTNRGCKAIGESGGATSVLLRDGMTRAPVVRFRTVKRTAELKFFLESPENFEMLAMVFNRSSRFARLQGIKCSLAGRNLYMRFSSSTGDAMGMNMVSKGVQNVLDYIQNHFPDMDVISISGNFCSDKKAAAVNWIEGRGKSVVCEAIIKEEVVRKVLKTSVQALVELNTVKNLAGSAMAGALGGFNAHASNIVTAIFIATGQDPAQNVESSQCITMMEAVNGGRDIHVSVTMPSMEVGTVGGGTQLASQSACLDLLGVKGPNMESPGANARLLATVVAGAVLAGELSLMSALAAGQLVKSHMQYNRSKRDVTKATP